MYEVLFLCAIKEARYSRSLLDPSNVVHGFFRIPCQFSAKKENTLFLMRNGAPMVACMSYPPNIKASIIDAMHLLFFILQYVDDDGDGWEMSDHNVF